MSEEEYKGILETITSYLNKLNVEYQLSTEKNQITIPFKFKVNDSVYTCRIFISWTKDWILCVAPLLSLSKFPPEVNREKFFKRLLLETYYLYEVTYGVTKGDTVVVHAETSTKALSFENFSTELKSVAYGTMHFVEKILPDFEKLSNIIF